VSHHTDLTGADALIAEAQRDLERILYELYVPRASEVALSEQARNVFVQLIAATRRNDPERKAVEKLAGMVGESAKGVIVRALLRRVQRECMLPPRQSHEPLPRGVSTPAPSSDERPTPVAPEPVVAIEDYASDGDPTLPITPKPTRGPWSDQITKPVKPRRR
jgi:hypothetical protein